MRPMSVISLLAVLAGIAIGAVLGFLFARSREASTATGLAARASAAEERARAASERAALVEGQLAERFQSLSAQALDASTRRFLEMAEGRLDAANAKAAGELDTRRAAVESLVGPLKETLARVEAQLRDSDAERGRSQVALAGMSSRCDCDEQVGVTADDGALRPDMVVRLAGGKNIVVDSEVSLAAYLEAAEAADESIRQTRLGAHARHLREHVDKLAAKAYWAALSPAPEFVVLFIPGEAFLAPALEHDPGLLEHAMARKVHIATPTTLVTMLRTAQYAWQQAALSENARAVFDVGRELYERLAGLGRHVDRLGKALTNAVTTYNQAVGSLESRVLVSARRFSQLGLVEAGLETPALVEDTARALSAPELTAEI